MENITKIQEQLLIGSLLGDGGIYYLNKNSKNPIFKEVHGPKQERYLFWKFKGLSIFNPIKYFEKNTWGKYLVIKTKIHPTLTMYRKMFYPNEKKIISKKILNKLDKFGLLVWYLDDGSYHYRGKYCYIAINPEWNLNIIKNYFKSKYNINTKISNRIDTCKCNYIEFNVKETKKLINIIKPLFYKYNLPKSMEYKLGNNKLKIEGTKHKLKKYLESIKEHKKKYMREYYKNNKDKWQRRMKR